ncbi:Linear gramicidin dehydrogenase LgrE [Paenibacillus plantiphilus]|uniref:Linear gramicidin dehydrogenase LgrE n=1 Tax=Paenibacillus plantiphilus TaxID=2905650 RepID=A0ABM9CAB0_9BACL|nr:thioesterase domain-containing protein [Paenibacillus plantiphilus]CAH1206495.1 Linear gramicidin dehydrogenase LgrE [Paenibacillus plantiphilus]
MMKPLKLFCFPYAGGSAYSYNDWNGWFHKSIQLIPIELSGRGSRFEDSLYDNFDEAVQDLYVQIKPHLDGTPFAFFGHSMGSLLSFELARLLIQNNDRTPELLFFSGCTAPHKVKREKLLHTLDDREFLEEIKKMEGTPSDFFQNDELMAFYLPILRNDFRIVEQYVYKEMDVRFPCSIMILHGSEEKGMEGVKEWGKFTCKRSSIHVFPGGHFFIHKEAQQVARRINNTLLSIISAKIQQGVNNYA